MNQDERVINLKDILAECLFKWRLILLAAIIGCVAGMGAAVYKTHEYQTALAAQQAEQATQEAAQQAAEAAAEEAQAAQAEAAANALGVHNGPYDEQMAEAKALLTQLEITKVDGLYAQYAANIQLRDSLADNINNSVIMKMDAGNASVARLMYTVSSDQDYIASNLNSLVVTDDLLEQAAKILGEDVSSKYLHDLFSVWKGSDGDLIYIYENGRTTSVIYLQAIAYTEEQADQIVELMAQALENAIKQMKSIDPNVEIRRVGGVSTAVPSSTIDDIQRALVSELNSVASEIVSMEVDEIGKLTEDEKTYYDLLVSEGKGIHVDESDDSSVAQETTTTETTAQPSKARYVLLGLIGLPVLVVVVLFLYLLLMSKKARSLTEIESGTGIQTLAVFERRLAKVKDPIVRAGINLQTADKAVENEQAYLPILQVRIKELLQQNGKTNLYLYGEGDTVLGGGSSFAATDGLDLAVTSGVPETSAEAMETFLQADSVILVTRMYETEIAALSNAIDLCKVHGKQILGNIVIYEA